MTAINLLVLRSGQETRDILFDFFVVQELVLLIFQANQNAKAKYSTFRLATAFLIAESNSCHRVPIVVDEKIMENNPCSVKYVQVLGDHGPNRR